jgi:predicted glycosyltransferase
VVTAVGGAFIVPVGKLAGVPSVVFTDTEHVLLDRYLTYPWASVVCTPYCFKRHAGRRHVRYRGFQELAYLDPRRFSPDPGVLRTLGLTEATRYAVVRFVSWEAGHDVGQSGLSGKQRVHLLGELSRKGRVLVSTEGSLPEEFQDYRIRIAPDRIHDLLYYASLYVGEGATMATEAALIGTPSVYVSTLAPTMGNYEELARLGLGEAYDSGEKGVARALELMGDNWAKANARVARERVVSAMADVTSLVVEIVESRA